MKVEFIGGSMDGTVLDFDRDVYEVPKVRPIIEAKEAPEWAEPKYWKEIYDRKGNKMVFRGCVKS